MFSDFWGVSYLWKCIVICESVCISRSVLSPVRVCFHPSKCFVVGESVLYLRKCFVIGGSVSCSWKCFVICRSVL